MLHLISSSIYKVNTGSSPLLIRTGARTNFSKNDSLSKGSVLYSSEKVGDWIKFYKGYLIDTYLVQGSPIKKMKTTTEVNVRNGPGTSYSKTTSLNSGTQIDYYGKDPFYPEWAVTNKGYISSTYLKDITSSSSSSTTLSSTSSTSSSSIFLNDSSLSILMNLLKAEEGVGNKGMCVAYLDKEGYPTIGVGHLCQKTKVSKDKASSKCSSAEKTCKIDNGKTLFRQDIDSTLKSMGYYHNIKSAFGTVNNKRQSVLVSMAYQMGGGKGGLSDFKKFLTNFTNKKWKVAAKEMLDSLWARQTPNRAYRQALVIYFGECNYNSNSLKNACKRSWIFI